MGTNTKALMKQVTLFNAIDNDIVKKFAKAKFAITNSGKFKARQNSRSYVEYVIEGSKDGKLLFIPGGYRGAYSKGEWKFSNKIIF